MIGVNDSLWMSAKPYLPLRLLVQLFSLIWDPSQVVFFILPVLDLEDVKEEGVSHLRARVGPLVRSPDDDGLQTRDASTRPSCSSSTPHRSHRHISSRIQRVP